jgi:myo-inositol-1(or 4)-monophosphatase
VNDTTDLEADRRLLRRAVTAAGALALEHFGSGSDHWHKAPGQVVTETDLAIDRLLHDILIGARPEDGWLSEERADDGSRHRRRRVWMVDPIDGTRAFADGAPEFAISIALVVEGRPVLGAVFNPATREHFEAERDGGARLNGAALRISERRELRGARLLSSRTEMRGRNWPQLIPEAEFTTMGSLAYKLALVAAGRFDGLVSLRASHDWDLAAAALLIGEAGGRISGADGGPLVLNQKSLRHAGLAAAGTSALHRALLARLRSVEGR